MIEQKVITQTFYQDRRKLPLKCLRSQRGVALLMVIWMETFLSIVLSSFAFSMRTEQLATKSFKDREEARSLAMAGVTRALTDIVNRETEEGGSIQTLSLYNQVRFPLGKGSYEVAVSDEEGRIPLITASPMALKTLLRNSGVTGLSRLDTIVDSILDWLDSDDKRRLNGAEEEYYRSLPIPYRPRNGPLENLDELLLVKGMSREILYGNIDDSQRAAELKSVNPANRVFRQGEYLGVHASLTVQSSGSVNLNSADSDVLVAAGLTYEEALSIQRRRAERPLKAQQPDLPPGRYWTTLARTFRIESVGRINNSPAAHRIVATMAAERATGKTDFKIVDWHEGLG